MRRVLFVFAWLVVGGEETEVQLLSRYIDPRRYSIDVVSCFHKPGMPEQTRESLVRQSITVDTAPHQLSFEDTVAYLGRKMRAYDVVVACQAVPDVYPALAGMRYRPPLIEHGGLVSEALGGPKHMTSRYIGVCESIRRAAASRMPDRPHHALRIPSMVDLSQFDRADRTRVRAQWAARESDFVVGWVGRLDRRKRVEDVIEAAAILMSRRPNARLVLVGGPDAFMPDYADELRAQSDFHGLRERILFLGDRDDVPALMAGMDAFVWLSKDEGMPHVISEAGAAGLPVIATQDNGSAEQIAHGKSGLFVPHRRPDLVAAALEALMDDPRLRQRLGDVLRAKVEREFDAGRVAPQWMQVFDEVIAEAEARPRPGLDWTLAAEVNLSAFPAAAAPARRLGGHTPRLWRM